MSVLIVASDRDGVGKTAAVLGIAESWRRRGADAIAIKPFASGEDDPDPSAISRVSGAALAGAAPVFSVGESAPTGDEWRSALGEMADGGADVVVEAPAALGIAGVSAAAEALDARVIALAGYRRDLDGADFAGWRDALGDRLAGVLVNGVTRYLGSDARERLAPSLSAAGVRCVGMIPEDRLMLSPTVEEVRAALGGEYVVDEGDIHRPLEYFQVGVMSLDPGRLRFGLYENNAVVVRGDRPDIQMSALDSSIACLLLTCGTAPIEYVLYEAREEETPVMLVETDTLTTMAALNGATARASAATPLKSARFADLLESHADIAAPRTA